MYLKKLSVTKFSTRLVTQKTKNVLIADDEAVDGFINASVTFDLATPLINVDVEISIHDDDMYAIPGGIYVDENRNAYRSISKSVLKSIEINIAPGDVYIAPLSLVLFSQTFKEGNE
jgi:hypothetical protein